MKPKLKPGLDLEMIQSDLIASIINEYKPGVSVRALAKSMNLSPMKVRKILITGGVYSTDLSEEIRLLYQDGKTVPEIAALLGTTTANVNSYLPYERIVYNMDERSVEADRQARYRERLKKGLEKIEKAENLAVTKVRMERKRTKTIVIVIGKKLRKYLPKDIYDSSSDPLARYVHSQDPWNPQDPEPNIWCAELTASGRGENRKQAIVLENAACGFTVVCALPAFTIEQEKADETQCMEYRDELKEEMLTAIRSGLMEFCLPEEHVLDYTDTVSRVEFIKGKPSIPAMRLEELIEQELKWKKGKDPLQSFRVQGNYTSRKFGNSPWYRPVGEATANMLGLDEEEQKMWMEDFMLSYRY